MRRSNGVPGRMLAPAVASLVLSSTPGGAEHSNA